MAENGSGGVEILAGFATVRAGAGVDRWSAASYTRGISFGSVGSRSLSMNVATLPAGGRIEPHVHDGYEVGLYILAGRLEHRFGPRLEHSLTNGAGDFIFVQPGVPHEAINLSDEEPVIVVVARTTADEWAGVVPYTPIDDPHS